MSQADLDDEQLDFDGETYEREEDQERLTSQLARVRDALRDGQWRTLREIVSIIAHRTSIIDPEASISARVRDLRKDRFGAFVVRHRRRGYDGGTWEYQIDDDAKGSAQNVLRISRIEELRLELAIERRRAAAYRAICDRALAHYEKLGMAKVAATVRALIDEVETSE
jgi:hypothetical protein